MSANAAVEFSQTFFSTDEKIDNGARYNKQMQRADSLNKIEQSGKHSSRSASIYSATASEKMRSPEERLSAFRHSLSEADPASETSSTLIMAFLSHFYPISVASAYASNLIERFGSMASLLRRSAEDIIRVAPLSSEAIFMLKVVHRVLANVLREPVEDRPIIGTHSALYDYLKFTMVDEGVETVRILFLNAKNMLIKDERHSIGTIDQAPIYPREIIKRILELSATALIIVHNHPSGDATPSTKDVTQTRQLKQVLDHMNVRLHDHLIVGQNGCVSFRTSGLL